MGPFRISALLRRLDEEGIAGHLKLLGSTASEAEAVPDTRSLARAWDEALAALPEDWSDLYVEVELDSSDYVEPGALALSPLNPVRYGTTPGLRFRVAQTYGYGGSPGMTRRCLERADEREITGQLRVLRALSDTKPAYTQGPVWYVDGKVL